MTLIFTHCILVSYPIAGPSWFSHEHASRWCSQLLSVTLENKSCYKLKNILQLSYLWVDHNYIVLSRLVFTASFRASNKQIIQMVLGVTWKGILQRTYFNDQSLKGSCKGSSLWSFQKAETTALLICSALFCFFLSLQSKQSYLGYCTRIR